MNLVDILQGAQVALAVIQQRVVLIVALLFTLLVFCYALWLGTAVAAIIAATWGLLIFLPVLMAGRGGSDVSKAPQHSEGPTPSG